MQSAKAIVQEDFLADYPDERALRERARRKIPRFAFEYLEGGCNSDENLHRNMAELREVLFIPEYLGSYQSSSIKTRLWDLEYDAPFGVAPIGLQGLIWPDSAEILARAALRHHVPFILSTVSTSSLERIAELTEGRAWFQLYYPAREDVRNDLLRRVQACGYPVLVALADVPTFGFRPRDIRNGLSMPPRMTWRNIWQMAVRPHWVWRMLRRGMPQFASLTPYIPAHLSLKRLGQFMDATFDGRLQLEKLQRLRDLWPHKLVVKGIVHERDAERCVQVGVDGIIVSNHGGRQLDIGQSTIRALPGLARRFGDRLTVMIDSGLRSGPDVARCLAMGARFTFLGRTFMYSVAALGMRGGNHAMAMLKMQLHQILEQLGCRDLGELPHRTESSYADNGTTPA